MTIEKLTPDQLRVATEATLFEFKNSAALTPAKPCTAQNRAVAALKTALTVPGPEYHVMLLGGEGTGRLDCLYSVLNECTAANAEIENPDRLLLPIRGRMNQYEEIPLQNSHAQTMINFCQQVAIATINGDPGLQSLMIQELRGGFSASPQLSAYIDWLDDFSLLLLAGENSEFDYRELHRMIPLLLHAGNNAGSAIIRDVISDTASLLGTLISDPVSGRTMINAGSLIQASGGYLILDALRFIEDPQHWRILRDVLKNGLIPLQAIQSVASSQGGGSLPLNGNIPLTCRVIMICDSSTIEQFLSLESDPEALFPVVAEFESELERNDQNSQVIASTIAALISQYRCLPLDAEAMALMIDSAARYTGTQHHLTLCRSGLSRLLREASLLANNNGEAVITRNHIRTTIEQGRQRLLIDRRDAVQAILHGEMQIELTGKVVGQINGLTMVGAGIQSYLEPARITATVRPGDGAIVDIEREVNLGGSIHSKGVLILSSLLAARYSPHAPLSLIASLVFEQSYAYVDGDSASAAEMMAILSAISGVPLKQSIAMTGSIDQRGQILCVGDINKKIEGFYRLCQQHGSVADAGVVIPRTNLRDLMLDDDVIQAVNDGHFTIYAVTTIDDVIEIFTAMEAGLEGDDHQFPTGSFNALMHDSLKQFAEENKHDHKDD